MDEDRCEDRPGGEMASLDDSKESGGDGAEHGAMEESGDISFDPGVRIEEDLSGGVIVMVPAPLQLVGRLAID